ncbi:AraC family transcriptional regulator [Flavobacterium sp.]|uniref:helix-turn-helix domain-containing protein n=1 Tax=Flavobacterium sp. TaxID=239 RepID=UPI00260A181B|nr:AraC family transcriptional regulator [Flavobacterium sp.]
MQFNFSFYSSLLLVFLVHLLVYSGMCLRRYLKDGYASDGWLGIFLLLSFLYVCPWMLGFAGWYNQQPYRDIMFYVPFQHLFFLGPVMFFYVLSLLNPGFRFRKKYHIHFLPGLLYIAYSLFMFIYDRFIYKGYYFLQDGQDRDFDEWYQAAGFISMLVYFITALRYYNAYRKVTLNYLSNADAFSFVWIRNFLTAVVFIFCAWLVLEIYSLIFDANYIDNWWYFIVFALLNYYIAIEGYTNTERSVLHFEGWTLGRIKNIGVLNNRQPALRGVVSSALLDYVPHESQDEITKEHTTEDFDEDIIMLNKMMKQERWYENPELSLPELAHCMKLNIHYLSRLINKGVNLNFNDYINKYRIEAVIDKFKNGEHKESTFIGIAIDCGFNSKATFNRAFKKHTGTTPKEYVTRLVLV